MKQDEPESAAPSSQAAPATAEVELARREAIRRLMKLGIVVPTVTALINMKVNNAFAEPGT